MLKTHKFMHHGYVIVFIPTRGVENNFSSSKIEHDLYHLTHPYTHNLDIMITNVYLFTTKSFNNFLSHNKYNQYVT